MLEFIRSLSFGTIPQWGMFVTMLTILAGLITVWIKGIPERLRARSEGYRNAAEEWQEIEARVTQKLDECEAEREADRQRIAHLDNENFKLRIVVSMVLQELNRLDPESDIVARAQAVMLALVTPAEVRGSA